MKHLLFIFNKAEIQNTYTLLGLNRILNSTLVMLFHYAKIHYTKRSCQVITLYVEKNFICAICY